jgi:hypothetical protein
VLFATAAVHAQEPVPRWPVPDGWRSETLRFPLTFARELPFKGVEEVRFAPGMFEPEAPGYWTYSFVWALEAEPDLSHKAIEAAVPRYFAGLCEAVGGAKYRFAPERFKAQLRFVANPSVRQGHTVRAYAGTISTYDPFTTGRELTLNAQIAVWDCSTARRRMALFSLSPKPERDEMWTALRKCAGAFTCHR